MVSGLWVSEFIQSAFRNIDARSEPHTVQGGDLGDYLTLSGATGRLRKNKEAR